MTSDQMYINSKVVLAVKDSNNLPGYCKKKLINRWTKFSAFEERGETDIDREDCLWDCVYKFRMDI